MVDTGVAHSMILSSAMAMVVSTEVTMVDFMVLDGDMVAGDILDTTT
jgi:hypothetical protein